MQSNSSVVASSILAPGPVFVEIACSPRGALVSPPRRHTSNCAGVYIDQSVCNDVPYHGMVSPADMPYLCTGGLLE